MAKTIEILEKEATDALQSIARLNDVPRGAVLDMPCAYDVGAGQVGPGGLNGSYVRQCPNKVMQGISAALCRSHAKKVLLGTVATNAMQIKMLKGEKPTASARLGIVDPHQIMLNVYEMAKGKGEKCATASGNVLSKDAFCVAMNQ